MCGLVTAQGRPYPAIWLSPQSVGVRGVGEEPVKNLVRARIILITLLATHDSLSPLKYWSYMSIYSTIAQELTSELQQLYPDLNVERRGQIIGISDSEESGKSVRIFVVSDSLLVELRSRHTELPPTIKVDYADPEMVNQLQLIVEDRFNIPPSIK